MALAFRLGPMEGCWAPSFVGFPVAKFGARAFAEVVLIHTELGSFTVTVPSLTGVPSFGNHSSCGGGGASRSIGDDRGRVPL